MTRVDPKVLAKRILEAIGEQLRTDGQLPWSKAEEPYLLEEIQAEIEEAIRDA